jgi:hypothetical protein
MIPPSIAATIRRVLAMAVLCLLGVGCVLYIGDYVRVRYKVAKKLEPFGSVKVQHYYAVKLKSGKVEYYFDTPQMQPCVHSLFPQVGYTPCWYLQRKADKGTNI